MTTLLSNLRLKLLAIFFAVALWSVVAYTSNPTQSKNYQLTIHPTVPSGLVIVGDVPPINVTVIGTADNLSKFDKSSLHVTGNFSNVKVGRNRVPIDVQNSDSSVNAVAPSSVQVTIDERFLRAPGKFDIVVKNPAPLAAPEWGNGTSNLAHLLVNYR